MIGQTNRQTEVTTLYRSILRVIDPIPGQKIKTTISRKGQRISKKVTPPPPLQIPVYAPLGLFSKLERIDFRLKKFEFNFEGRCMDGAWMVLTPSTTAEFEV